MHLILLPLLLFLQLSPSSGLDTMNQGSSLSVEEPKDIIVSQNGMFCAGFYAVGENAYSFAIWYSEPNHQTENLTLVWNANRNQPVNGRGSKLHLLNNGNLVLKDADESLVWSANTVSLSSMHLVLLNTGNLVLREVNGVTLWQSFDSPTDTLLPQQVFNRHSRIVCSRSETNKSSGFYMLYFDNDNILRLLYDGPEVSSIYWPDPWLTVWDAKRAAYNNSRVAVLNTLGNFSSSDDFNFMTSDYGDAVMQRRLRLDPDGNIRTYSRKQSGENWYISWQAKSRPCRIHGVCGVNSLCSYYNDSAKCCCLPGYKMKNPLDWAYGCEPEFSLPCKKTQSQFLVISNVELFGYDYGIFVNYTLARCKDLCLQLCNCKGIQYAYVKAGSGIPDTYTCYPKLQLRNGYRIPYYNADLYLKLPANSSYTYKESMNDKYKLACPTNPKPITLERSYEEVPEGRYIKFLLLFVGGMGGLEILCIFFIRFFFVRTKNSSSTRVYNSMFINDFRKFSYSELKKATKNFSQEIGIGAAGVVYKGLLLDERVIAVKRLTEANQGEEQFLAEVSSIGRLNHMNLIELWGYCAEGKHRMLVYEFMENGSLAQHLRSSGLDWPKRFDIALGTARGLAYIHEECLEWILHCDVKPQNILLDSDYQPKVADFGLSKLRDRSDAKFSSFSKIRGTRGYMAPEWILNHSITSKIDVYSYGMVVLEIITGRSATKHVDMGEGEEKQGLVIWLREKRYTRSAWVSEIIDPTIEEGYDESEVEALAEMALQCVEEDKDKRPTMSHVVEVLQKLSRENEL
ncbi:putative receptor protein kinase ZmPK1 [Vicia villosa]|uniref:putative receptor protein kinase ZmPK1 n=1 Tax=Vicia villosa TaxID=3911 RepID=UPI00273C9FD4|nr:putative receptor protein kinase ZmPK1 [Vicia villosa]